ncbi:MAG: biopolymer transporter ExbD [Kiritimatiellaeota bacterium]|nr:biopolymer transporter ExbD [Kiritimatiellota bacterium]
MKLKISMEDVGFQMAPLIDCVFQLMIFFMCASHLHLTLDAPPIEVPVAEHSSIPEELQNRRYVTIQFDGTIQLGGATVNLNVLRQEIAKAQKQMPDLKIFLRADRRLVHKKVREVMQVLAEAGAGEIIFATYQSETM